MKKAEIIIIGGGVIGASVAYHLTGRGAGDVLILESQYEQGTGSTGKATGGVRAQFGTEINIRMSLYSLEFFNNWEFDCEYEPAGYLFVTNDAERLERMRTAVAFQRELGVDVEIIGCDNASRLVPGLNCEDLVGGAFGPRDGFINPLAVMRGFTETALRSGAEIRFGTSVLAIETNGGKVTGIITNNGPIECENIVLCTGARAAALAKTAGIDLPVEPMRRQIIWARPTAEIPQNMPMVIDADSGFHFRPARDFNLGAGRANGDVLMAYPDPDETSSINCDFDKAFIDKVFEHVKHRAPFLNECEVISEKCRAGLYENTPDHHAILGGCGVDGLYFANGFSGHGVMHSPATGRALSEIMLDGRSEFLDVSNLHIDRFAQNELLHETAFI